MTKKHFVALAAAIRAYQDLPNQGLPLMNIFTDNQIRMLADFCQSQNAQFDRERFLAACGVK